MRILKRIYRNVKIYLEYEYLYLKLLCRKSYQAPIQLFYIHRYLYIFFAY